MAKLRKPALVTALLLLGALALGSIGAQAASPPTPAPHASRALAFSSPRVSTTSARPRISTASPITCDGTFDLVTSPNGTGHNDIFATSAVSANDVWAVGVQTVGTIASFNDRTLAEHWNGTAWSIVPTPNPTTTYWDDLNSVVAISTNDVWAVGDYQVNATGYVNTFAAHWNGTSWTLVPSTQNPMFYNWLFAVDAVSSTDVWAVGTSWSAGYFTLVEHWNGSAWSVVSSPNQLDLGSSTDNLLFSVSAFSSTDVWAVGYFGISTFHSLAEHWDGGSWSIVATPNLSGDNQIASVKALEAGHAVGVGYGNSTNGVTPAQAEAWDLLSGGGSTSQGLGALGSGDNILEGVARSGSSVWAVGFWRNTNSDPRQTLAWPATWNSVSHTLTWGSVGTSASPASVNNVLFAVSAVSPNVFWAAGYMNSGGFDQSLVESFCGVHFGIAAPASTFIGASFSLTVTAKNANGTTDTAYRGTIHFTSTDAGATLPGDYTFTAPDAGAHTFTGVVLNTPYSRTITVTDTVTAFITASTVVAVTCNGTCQSSGGSPGSRGATQSGSGAAGPRYPSTGPARPGPRTADLAAGQTAQVSVGTAALVRGDAGADRTPAGSTPVQRAGAPGAESAGPTVVLPVQVVRSTLGLHQDGQPALSVRGGDQPLLPGAAAVLGLASLLLPWARRRNNRRLNDNSKP